MQGPQQWNQGLAGLDQYEQMVDTLAEQAKSYWKLWGTMGVPMVQSIDAWAKMQRAYLQQLRRTQESLSQD
jgi:hypothetical protein